jgi:mRNA interferase RelE/StbE
MINYKYIISKRAKKKINNLNNNLKNKITDRIINISNFLNGKDPDIDIKQLKGKWKDFYRLRLGKIRVIFKVELDVNTIKIYDIGSRGDIYK